MLQIPFLGRYPWPEVDIDDIVYINNQFTDYEALDWPEVDIPFDFLFGELPDDGAPEDDAQEDFISELPDAVIHEILSSLSLQDVVRCSTLSKRWRGLATSTPYFNLSLPSFHLRRFANFLNKALSRFRVPKLEKFHLDASSLESWRSEIVPWLRFAADSGVRSLSLKSSRDGYVLPHFLYECASLESLHLSRGDFWSAPGNGIYRWSSLKMLCMEGVNLRHGSIAKVLSGSPVLESLVIRGCWSTDDVEIESITLRELVIDDYSVNLSRPSKLKLSAPRLLVLRLLGGLSYWNFITLDEISSLVEVELDLVLRFHHCGSHSNFLSMTRYLLRQLRHVPKVTIGSWHLQVLSVMRGDGLLVRLPSSISKWQNLILRTSFSKLEVPGIAYLLESSPHLEKFIIHRTNIFRFEVSKEFLDFFVLDEEEFWRSHKKNFQCVANHLTSVEIVGFSFDCFSFKIVLSLLMFLLEEAIVLEKMTINAEVPKVDVEVPIEAISSQILLGVTELLAGRPKASEKAELIVNYSAGENYSMS